MKRSISFILSLILITGSFSAAYAAEADNGPKGMVFSGDEIRLSLDDAVKRMTSTGPAFEGVMLTEKANKAASRGQFELIDKIKELSNADPIQQQMASQAGMPTSMNSLKGRQASLARDFYRVYTPVAKEAGLNGISNKTIQSYYGLLMAQENYSISCETASVKNTLLTNTQKKYDLGMASHMELLQAQTAAMNAEQDKAEALTSLNTTRMQFNMAMDYDLMQKVTLTDTLKEVPFPSDIDLDECIKTALSERGEIIKSKYEMDNAELEFRDVHAYPRNSATYMGKEAAFSGKQFSYKMQLLSTELGIRQAYMELYNKKAAVINAKAVCANAKEGVRLTQLRYDLGMCTMPDLQTAQNSEASAKLGVAMAITEYDIAVNSFNYMVHAGTM